MKVRTELNLEALERSTISNLNRVDYHRKCSRHGSHGKTPLSSIEISYPDI